MSGPLGFAAAVRAYGDAWRVRGACQKWKAQEQRAGDALFRAGDDGERKDHPRDYFLMLDFMPGRMYADRSRAWGGKAGE